MIRHYLTTFKYYSGYGCYEVQSDLTPNRVPFEGMVLMSKLLSLKERGLERGKCTAIQRKLLYVRPERYLDNCLSNICV